MAKTKKKDNKVVYNGDYGGFNLSDKAVIWLEQNAEDKEVRDFLAKEREIITSERKEEECLWGTIESTMQFHLVYNFGENGIPRHHKDLVAVVEKLGKDASGTFSDLAIAKIKGNIYRIDEYDGWESVVEPDDMTWITIEDETKNNA